MFDSQRLLVHPYACGIFISAVVRLLHCKTEIFAPGGGGGGEGGSVFLRGSKYSVTGTAKTSP